MEKKYRKVNYYYNSEILDKFKAIGDKLIGEFVIDKYNKFVIENIIRYYFGEEFLCNIIDSKEKKEGKLNKGLFIAGECGTGKTTLMRIFKKFCKEYNQIFYINDKPVYPNWVSYNAQELCNIYRNGGNIESLYNAPIISIDDFGTEPESSQYMGNKIDVLREILEVRSDKNVITFITSNLTPDDCITERKYGERLVSRLKEYNYFALRGDDRRES